MALVRVVTKNLMVILVELHDHICRWEKPTEGQTSLHHWALWRCGQTQSSPQWRQKETHSEFTKKHLKDPQTLRNAILWFDEPQFQALCLKVTSSAHHLQSAIPKVKCAGSSLMLWGCFSAAGTDAHIRIEEKLNAPKYWDSRNENPVQHSETQTG